MRILPIILLAIWIFSACSLQNNKSKDEIEIEAVADSFTTNYYSWHFKDAATFSNDNFKRQLLFLSSNISKADIEVLKSSSKNPEFSIDNIKISEGEATVKLQLQNIFVLDSIGALPHLEEETTHTLLLKKENGKWKVNNVRVK